MAALQDTTASTPTAAAAAGHAPGRDGATGGPVCELIGVTKVYASSNTVVGPIDLSIGNGEFFSLLGPSGCGKSTTLRMIAGLESVTSGRININGRDETHTPPNRRPSNMVFQDLALFPHLDVASNIGFGLKVRRVPRQEIRKRVAEMLDLVYLNGFEKRRIQELSGGQRQRVAIARALIQRPAMVLLDEPLGALDLRLRLDMQQMLKSIQRTSGTSFVYVTHDQTEAFAMSDRIGVMSQGRLLQVGTPAEIYERPASAFIAKFVGDSNLIEGRSVGGEFQATGLPIRARGEGSWLAIRPECIVVGPRVETRFPGSCVRGHIEDIAYLGAATRYVLRLTNGKTLTAAVQRTEAPQGLRPGDETTAGWNPRDALVVPD